MEYKRLGELPYIERKPTVFLGKCPTIIFLHGAGSRGTDLRILGQNSLFGKNSCIGAEDSPFVVFAPLCIRNTWFDVFEQLQELVKIAAESPEVDPERIYLMGTSMGGYGAWQLAMTMPEYFAALIPICGGGMRWNVSRLLQIPVWAFHGTEDPTIPMEESVLLVDELNRIGGDARLTRLEGVGHNCWDYAYAQKELFEWVLAQKNPKV